MAANFFDGQPELQNIVTLSARQLAPLDGLDTEFYRLDLDLDGTIGYYGPLEKPIADSLKLVSDRSFQNIEAMKEAFKRAHGNPKYQSHVLGAVDCALWDARAKQAEKSLAEFSAAGSLSNSVACYASMITLDIDGPNTQAIADSLSHLGFWGQKWDLPEGPENGAEGLKRNLARIAKLREAAPDARLMIELHRRWTPEYLEAFIKQAHNMNLTWLEDPFPAENTVDYLDFSKISSPICLGEKLTSPEAFEPYLAGNYVLQPDVIACGGYTAAQQINTSGKAHGKPVAFHGRRLVPSFHLAISRPHNQVIEFNPIFEPERQIAMGQRIIPENGFLQFRPEEWSGLWQP